MVSIAAALHAKRVDPELPIALPRRTADRDRHAASDAGALVVDYPLDGSVFPPDFVPPTERIAVFDNDGTLLSEKPLYFQLLFALDRVRALAGEHPDWKETEPFRAILEDDREAMTSFGEQELVEIVMATHAGMTADEFDDTVVDWLATAMHPRFGVPYTELVYQPMLELLDYLRAAASRPTSFQRAESSSCVSLVSGSMECRPSRS